jgi:4-amino-4-deoxy-L-arabinose transferase-like glycosyltransferase
MSNDTEVKGSSQLFEPTSIWLKICLIALFVWATIIRLDEIKAPGHLLDREYTSAIFARAYYFSNNHTVEDWRRQMAITTKNQQPILEPPLLELMVSLIYRVMNREEIFFARYLTNLFWLIGGLFMFLITRKLLGTDEAVVAAAYFLLVPMGILISRSFQPDSLMMMLFLATLYLLVLYFEAPSPRSLLAVAALSSVTLLLRPLVLFAIFCAYLAFSFWRNKDWRKIIDSRFLVFSVISLTPFLLYYGYGIIYAGFMQWKIPTSFMPHLLLKRDFWLGWIDLIVDVAEFAPLIFAIPGFFLLRSRQVQYLVIGLVIAFIIFSVTFTYHIHTHPYYHIQLFPIIALCLSPVVVSSVKMIRLSLEKYWRIPILAVILLCVYVVYRDVRAHLYQTRLEDPRVAWEIGEIIRHSPRTVYVAFYYGIPLTYYGEFGGAPWPVRIDDEFYRRPGEQERSVQERLDGLGFTPEFFVITHFDLFARKHQDLKEYLTSNCTLISQTDRYLIYGSCMDPSLPSSISLLNFHPYAVDLAGRTQHL